MSKGVIQQPNPQKTVKNIHSLGVRPFSKGLLLFQFSVWIAMSYS